MRFAIKTAPQHSWADAGLDLAIVYLPPLHRASVLEPLAHALASVSA